MTVGGGSYMANLKTQIPEQIQKKEKKNNTPNGSSLRINFQQGSSKGTISYKSSLYFLSSSRVSRLKD